MPKKVPVGAPVPLAAPVAAVPASTPVPLAAPVAAAPASTPVGAPVAQNTTH